MGVKTLSDLLPFGIALLSAVVALLAVWQQFRSSLPGKELSVEILSDISLPFTKGLQNEINISTPLPKQMRLISVRVRNTGSADILSSDYLEPIRLTFNEPVLSSSLTEAKATSSVPLKPEIDQDIVELPTMLLHPRGFITINTLLSGDQSSITVKGLIADGQIVMAKPSMQSIPGSWRWSESPN